MHEKNFHLLHTLKENLFHEHIGRISVNISSKLINNTEKCLNQNEECQSSVKNGQE